MPCGLTSVAWTETCVRRTATVGARLSDSSVPERRQEETKTASVASRTDTDKGVLDLRIVCGLSSSMVVALITTLLGLCGETLPSLPLGIASMSTRLGQPSHPA